MHLGLNPVCAIHLIALQSPYYSRVCTTTRACSDTWVGFQKTPIERRLISSLWISRVVVVAPIQSIHG